jgi:hypothetical protein
MKANDQAGSIATTLPDAPNTNPDAANIFPGHFHNFTSLASAVSSQNCIFAYRRLILFPQRFFRTKQSLSLFIFMNILEAPIAEPSKNGM